MGAESRNRSTDAALAALALRQEGLLRREDLLREGLGRKAVPYRVRTSRLFEQLPGVYTLGPGPFPRRTDWLAAIWSWHGLLRVTNRSRTLIDEASGLSFPTFRARADRLKALPVAELAATLERAPGRPGVTAARRLLAGEDTHTKSELERRYLGFCGRHGVPRPTALNVWVAGHKVDCLHRDERLVIELDSRAHHERRAQMRADRQRDTDYQLAHHRILRLTWWDLEPEWAPSTAAKVVALLRLGNR